MRKREQKKKNKPEPFLQVSNWGQGEDGKEHSQEKGRPPLALHLKSMEREVWVLFWDNPGLSWSLPGMMGILYINKTWEPWGRGMGLPHIPSFMSSRPHTPLRMTEGRLGSFPESTGLR